MRQLPSFLVLNICVLFGIGMHSCVIGNINGSLSPYMCCEVQLATDTLGVTWQSTPNH